MVKSIPGGSLVPIGPGLLIPDTGPTTASSIQLDAALEAAIYVGHVVTSDGLPHTIDTSGLSRLGWLNASGTFVNAGTTLKVGLAAVHASAGPPARADHSANAITFAVSKTIPGNSGGLSTNAWNNHIPDAGSLTIASGDLLAFAIQMTARGGADVVRVQPSAASSALHRPAVTSFVGGSYAALAALPNTIIKFADGAYGYFHGSDVLSLLDNVVFDSASSPSEYGQLFQFPFPVTVCGVWGWAPVTANLDLVLYSDPLGTPVAERTCTIDVNQVQTTAVRKFFTLFSSPYTVPRNTPFVVAFKPGTTPLGLTVKLLNNAAHRVADAWGVNGHAVSRTAAAAFESLTGLVHLYVGVIASGFDDAAPPAEYVLGIA